MALFKISKGLKENLPATYNEGYCYFTIDDGKFYIDTTDDASGRVVLNASLADKLATANTLTIGNTGKSFDGSSNVSWSLGEIGALPLTAGENHKLTGPLGLTADIMYGTTKPESGFEGQLFFVEDDGTGEDNGPSLPAGGTAGQILTKNSATDGDASWKTADYLPLSGGTINDMAFIQWPDTGNWGNSNAGVTFPVQHGGLKWSGQSDYIKIFSEESASDTLDLIAQFGDDGSSAFKIRHSNGTNTITMSAQGIISASQVYGAVWNDYAEYRNQKETIEPGYCVASTNDGKVYKTTEKFQACDGIVSDTFGFAIGETNECKTPLAAAGRVLAYCTGSRNDYHSGDTVCAGPDGKVMKMTREEIKEYPDRIVGIVSEIPEYETWGTGNVQVNGRIWIKVK